jgi:hypothetical protein
MFRSLVLSLALVATPALLLAQAPTNRPNSGGSRPQAERPTSTQGSTAQPKRPDRATDRQASPDRKRPPARSTGEPELKRRKP